MKTLDEKKKLAEFARAFGQPDLELEESIRLEEELNSSLFAKPKKDPPAPIPILREVIKRTELKEVDSKVEIKPAQTNIVPREQDLIQQTVSAISSSKVNKSNLPDFQQKEIDGLRKQIAEIIQRLGTLSWGSGGTGIVRLWDADDFDRNSVADAKQFVTFRNGYFQLDLINPNETVANTAYVTSNNYTVTADDYYIGVNVASTVTITLPTTPDVYTGREFYVKDESGEAGSPGRWIDIYPSGTDKIDGEDYVRLEIDWGGLKFIYRNGWRII